MKNFSVVMLLTSFYVYGSEGLETSLYSDDSDAGGAVARAVSPLNTSVEFGEFVGAQGPAQSEPMPAQFNTRRAATAEELKFIYRFDRAEGQDLYVKGVVFDSCAGEWLTGQIGIMRSVCDVVVDLERKLHTLYPVPEAVQSDEEGVDDEADFVFVETGKCSVKKTKEKGKARRKQQVMAPVPLQFLRDLMGTTKVMAWTLQGHVINAHQHQLEEKKLEEERDKLLQRVEELEAARGTDDTRIAIPEGE